MSGCPSFEELVDWAEGITSSLPDEHDPGKCTRCARMLDDYKVMVSALKTLPPGCAWPEEPPTPAANVDFHSQLSGLPKGVARANDLVRDARALYGKDWLRVQEMGEAALELLAVEPEGAFARSFVLATRADTWEILGNAAARLGRIEEGIRWLELARDFWAQRGEPHAHAATHTNLAVARLLQRDLEGARADANRAIELFMQFDQTPDAITAMQVLAIVLMDLGEHGEASDLNRRVISLLQQAGRLVDRAMALRTLAELELKQGNRGTAAASLLEAIPVLKQHDRLHDAARCEAFLGLVESADPETSESGLKRMVAVREMFAASGLWLDALCAGIKEIQALVGLRRIADARRLLTQLADLVPVDRHNAWAREWMKEYSTVLADDTVTLDEHFANLTAFEARLMKAPERSPSPRDMN